MCLVENAATHDCRTRPFPIERIDIPKNDAVAELLRNPVLLVRCNRTVWWAEKRWPHADRVADDVIRALQLRARGIIRHLREVWMRPRVGRDLVTFVRRASEHVRILLYALAEHEKRHFHVTCRENVEQLWC